MNYYQFHIADWTLHTAHLTLEEEAVYRRLLDFYYDTESPIPEKTQSVIRRLRLGSYENLVASVLDEFFVLEADGWHNLRADREIEDYNAKAERARSNGKKGGRPKKQKQQKQGDSETQNPEKTQSVISGNPEKTGSKANQEPRTINQEPINPQPPSGEGGDAGDEPDLFALFWEAYPRKTAKQSAEKAWKKLKPDAALVDEIIAHIEQRAASGDWSPDRKEFIPHPATFLNGKRWTDEILPRGGSHAENRPGSPANPTDRSLAARVRANCERRQREIEGGEPGQRALADDDGGLRVQVCEPVRGGAVIDLDRGPEGYFRSPGG